MVPIRPAISSMELTSVSEQCARSGIGSRCLPALGLANPLAKEFIMRSRIFAVATVAGALIAPIAAQAQTVGIVRGDGVVVRETLPGIAIEQRPAFREYIIRERIPNYSIPEEVVVGGVLPEAGVTYYDVPQSFGATPYRYTVVNGQTVLVEPRSRRIVQVVD